MRSAFILAPNGSAALRSTTFIPHRLSGLCQQRPQIHRVVNVSATVAASIETPSENVPLADTLQKVPQQFRASLLRLPEDAEIAEPGARHTKIVATIGPSTCSADNLLRLAAGGVNLIRLNLSHGDFTWHRRVINEVRSINLTTPFVLGVMIDVGSYDTVRLGAFSRNPVLSAGDKFTLTVRHQPEYPEGVSEVSDDGFISIVEEGDLLQCQADVSGTVELLVKSVADPDVLCEVVSPGELKSRGEITIRGKSLNLSPRVKGEDLNISIARAVLGCPPDHLEFAMTERVEYIALSFVESAEQINAIKGLIHDRGANVGIIAKIESSAALRNLESIVRAADAVMVARGDLATTINYEKVPYWQARIAQLCRQHGKPCLISTHFLESMVSYPTPTRAEVTDMTEAVKQRVDALVLTAETASGRFPFKVVATMDSVLLRMQHRLQNLQDEGAIVDDTPPLETDPLWWASGVGDVAENIAKSATGIANSQNVAAILVFTQKGLMATLASRFRPKAPIYAFTATPKVRNKLNLLYGVRPFRLQFQDDPEETIEQAISLLLERKMIKKNDSILVLADVLGGREGTGIDELRTAFAGVSKGKRFITVSEVRSALRILGLKVSDRLEARFGMREDDVKEADLEIDAVNEPRDTTLTEETLGKYDFDRFVEFASSAKEIVHTLQIRTIA